jgi:hypothetical protein
MPSIEHMSDGTWLVLAWFAFSVLVIKVMER